MILKKMIKQFKVGLMFQNVVAGGKVGDDWSLITLQHDPFFGKSHPKDGHSKKESTDQYELLRYNEKTLKRIALNAQEE